MRVKWRNPAFNGFLCPLLNSRRVHSLSDISFSQPVNWNFFYVICWSSMLVFFVRSGYPSTFSPAASSKVLEYFNFNHTLVRKVQLAAFYLGDSRSNDDRGSMDQTETKRGPFPLTKDLRLKIKCKIYIRNNLLVWILFSLI